jgi:hypothetical protein
MARRPKHDATQGDLFASALSKFSSAPPPSPPELLPETGFLPGLLVRYDPEPPHTRGLLVPPGTPGPAPPTLVGASSPPPGAVPHPEGPRRLLERIRAAVGVLRADGVRIVRGEWGISIPGGRTSGRVWELSPGRCCCALGALLVAERVAISKPVY